MLDEESRVAGLLRSARSGSVGPVVLLLVVLVLVLAPVALLIVNTFQLGTIGQYVGWGFGTWREALSNPRIPEALWNTVWLAVTRQSIGLVIGIFVAWLIARTDLPGRDWLEFGFWVAVFLPGLTTALAWIFLLDPFNGVINQWLVSLPFIEDPPFNIFSSWGIIWVHLVSGTLPVKVMLLAPAFRALDSSLEEAARASGDTRFGALRRVSLPILMPTILVVLVLGVVRAFEAFEVELILGKSAGIEVLTSLIYNLARDSNPPLYGQATVVSLAAVALLLPAIIIQQRFGSRHSVATVGGKFKSQPQRLGRWRWPAFAFVLTLVLLMTAVPLVALLLGTFMKFFGVFSIAEPWTLDHWSAALSSPLFTGALGNSLTLSVATMLFSLLFFSTVAYVIARTRFRGRGMLDFFAWMPSIIPGVVLGLGYLWVFLNVPGLRDIYGTIWILVLVAALGSMTLSVQLVKSGLRQLGTEMEEASWAAGASKLRTIRHVVAPLLAPMLVVVALTTFSTTARTTSHVALLATSQNQPLSILQLNQMADHAYGPASVIGVFILFLTVGVALAARAFGYRRY